MSVPHAWRRNEYGEIDFWATESGYHNGPMCDRCYDAFCEHCEDAQVQELLSSPCVTAGEIPGQLDIYDMLEET